MNRNTLQEEVRCSINTHVAVQDCLFLSLVVLLSLILYVQSLGFYSDDWSFFGYLSTSADQSPIGLFQTLYDFANIKSRPVQALYLAGLYWLFGLHPLGYHLVNAGVLLSGVVLFYLVLRELNQGRVLTLTGSLVYGLLPHYSTDRFWYAAFVANLSMALYFLSLYADLRALRTQKPQVWGWKLLSILSLLGSTLSYEVFLPLFLLNLFLLWYRTQQFHRTVPGNWSIQVNWVVIFGSNLFILMLVSVFKALTASRLGKLEPVSHIVWLARFVKQAISVSYGDYGLGLPGVMLRLLRDYPNWVVVAVGVMLSLIIFGYLNWTASQSKTDLTERPSILKFLVWGLVVFGLGYAIFLTNENALIAATGIANRIAIASAVGVALSLVGGIGWVSAFLPSDRLRRRCFCVLVALLCTSGFAINNTVASFWIDSYRQQQEILADIRQQFPTLPAASTLILDGVCPYLGPAIIFESSWDLAGALMTFYRDRTLRADVVTPNLKVEEDRLSTMLYGGMYSHYPYNEKLFVYHIGRKTTHYLTDVQAARRYFQTFNPDFDNDCPPSREGFGVQLF
jgi:hypothetical protein